MDLWLIAATAATGYVTKHLQNVSKGKETFPEDLSYVKPESPTCLVSRLVCDKTTNEENFEDCGNGEDLDVLGVAREEICSDSFGNRAFLRRKQRYRRLIKPFSMENSVVSRLPREEEYMFSPFPSPCGSFSRPLVVTDGAKVISKSTRDSISQGARNCGIPQLKKLETSGLYGKRRGGNTSRISDNGIGSSDAALLLCVGISIGIMSSFVTNQTEVNKVRAELEQTEKMVKESEDELKTKDSLTVNDDLHDGEKQCEEKTPENSESISEIEAELEAELERLQINMNSSNIETQPSDVFELEPNFEVEFAQGELRDGEDQRFYETESNLEPCGNATPESGNYSVSPRELSLRLHKIINSRCEERIKELEIALQESQMKVERLEMEAEEKKKPYSRLWESDAVWRDSIRKHNPVVSLPVVEVQPLVMNLAGPALDAFNGSYEELMDIKDNSEEGDFPYEMHETEREEELYLTSKSSPWSQKDYRKASSRTSEDVNLFLLQDLLGLSDDDEEEDGGSECEMEKQLIKQIVEKAKQGSSAVFNTQKMLSLMEEIEHNP